MQGLLNAKKTNVPRQNYSDIQAFIAVAREKSFTKAAANLSVSQSALSHTVRNLESRLGIRLLTRTTRSVSTTEAGQRLVDMLVPRFEEIDAEIAALGELRDKPAGTVRLSASDHAVDTILWPKLTPIMQNNPDIIIEFNIDYGLTDIVKQRIDAGVRFGRKLEKDMIAVRIGPDLSRAVVASPKYFANKNKPLTPQELVNHHCINMRLPSYGGLFAWRFQKDGNEITVNVNGHIIVNTMPNVMRSALEGHGLAYLPEDCVEPYLQSGELIQVLQDWCPKLPGYHLYYPDRRNPSPAFRMVVDALKYSEPEFKPRFNHFR